jgi:hypothetical protein
LACIQHQLRNPIYKIPGNFGYKPELANDFSTIDFVQTPRFHLLQLKCGEQATVVAINVNTDGTGTTKRQESHLVYLTIANGRGTATTSLETVQLIGAVPHIDQDIKLYGGQEEKKYAELVVFHAYFEKMFRVFNKASDE